MPRFALRLVRPEAKNSERASQDRENAPCRIWTESDDELLPFMADMLTTALGTELVYVTRACWLDAAVEGSRRRVFVSTPLRRAAGFNHPGASNDDETPAPVAGARN